MPKQYAITILVPMPDGLGAQSTAIAKIQPHVETLIDELKALEFAPTLEERLTEPKGPRAAKVPAAPNGAISPPTEVAPTPHLRSSALGHG